MIDPPACPGITALLLIVLGDLPKTRIPALRWISAHQFLEPLRQVVGDRRRLGLLIIELVQNFVDPGLDRRLAAHANVGGGKHLAIGRHFGDAMLGELALDPFDELVGREGVKLDALGSTDEEVDFLFGGPVLPKVRLAFPGEST